ncbi:MAG: putative zinc-binding metallopeptidase [Chlamydiae bacterium]|nr:putative zinc-binding metallopeptidase [Chlamydiota bacterium]MBI3265754.1 putative zinc-binding metallopeptidase [Chlamydiota bacterium]
MSQTLKRERDKHFLELEDVLQSPVHSLGLTLRGSRMERCIQDLLQELNHFKIILRPHFYLSDGYGTCEGTANIGLAFWDVDHTLSLIAARYLGEYYRLEDIRMVLRHEMGHAFCYSYKLYRLKEFRQVFRVKGHFFNTYPVGNRYHRNPWSHDFVNPCGDCYAQKHPDDDFAETFATLLSSKLNWKRRYRHRKGALAKLYYVESLIQEWGRRRVIVKNDLSKVYGPVEEISSTVRRFFAAKRAQRN